ncbi:MAG: GNAT family N-acetyltransferase [Deinococcales bacterium]
MTADRPPAGRASGFRIRAYERNDLPALYRICLRTGDDGGDASRLYDDPELLGHVYVGPYAVLEPEHALVLTDPDGRACGYAVAALDTVAFHARVRERWLPPLRQRYPDPAGDPRLWTADERQAHLLHHPDDAYPRTLPPAFEPYPSHLHIDLLPLAQGQGLGRSLIERLLALLAADGSPGAHLGVSARNERALGFYRHLGFMRLSETTGGTAVWMAKRLP